mgnify:CR=1 FL=1
MMRTRVITKRGGRHTSYRSPTTELATALRTSTHTAERLLRAAGLPLCVHPCHMPRDQRKRFGRMLRQATASMRVKAERKHLQDHLRWAGNIQRRTVACTGGAATADRLIAKVATMLADRPSELNPERRRREAEAEQRRERMRREQQLECARVCEQCGQGRMLVRGEFGGEIDACCHVCGYRG